MGGVSYVTTIYNKEEFIRPVVESLLSQKGSFEREYIFINDGSTDNSLGILEQLIRGRGDCTVVSEKNVGPSKATNKGLKRASCEYIKLVDGDDILSLDMTANLLAAAKKNNCSVVIGEKGSYIASNGGGGNFVEPEKPQAYVLNRPLKKLLKNAFFTPTHMLFKRELLDEVGGCDEKVFIQDYSIALRLARVSSFAIEPEAVFYAPEVSEGRMSANLGQILHDLNAALYGFCCDYPDLDPALVAYCINRATGRAWRWARREKVSREIKSEMFFEYLKNRLPGFSKSDINSIRKSCQAFQSGQRIKYPLQ